jgi:GDP/GTP exchange factor required for growth at low temperature
MTGASWSLIALDGGGGQKCYRQSNFQTLAQIIYGLQSPHVERLKRTWARVGMWEMRVFKDLKAFTSHLRNFRSLRHATDALADEWGPPGQGHATSDPPSLGRSSGGAAKAKSAILGCIPFLGMYAVLLGTRAQRADCLAAGVFLRDLSVTADLPTFLDPTWPNSEAVVDEKAHVLERVIKPDAFGDLAPLPASVRLAPLVNVHKFRTQAAVVQHVLAFQEMASLNPRQAEAGLFRKCLAIRCLSVNTMRDCSRMCEP